jgi:hypothetical protein
MSAMVRRDCFQSASSQRALGFVMVAKRPTGRLAHPRRKAAPSQEQEHEYEHCSLEP